tara:strand:+ start:775 stop:1209 length:435 start_codon:yes stop_codon:yes gene_type:complete
MCKVDFVSSRAFSLNQEKLIRFLKKYAENDGFTISQIQYNFISQPDMLKINKDYLNHNTHTDIITFDYSTKKTIKAEVYISNEMMKENAKKFGQTIENEMIRLISHALFHCMGYSDKTTEEKKQMRSLEDSFINDVSRETISNV